MNVIRRCRDDAIRPSAAFADRWQLCFDERSLLLGKSYGRKVENRFDCLLALRIRSDEGFASLVVIAFDGGPSAAVEAGSVRAPGDMPRSAGRIELLMRGRHINLLN